MRNKVKRLAIRLVDKVYGLHPDVSTLTTSSDAKVMRAARGDFVKKKVAKLLAPGSPFLKAVHDVRVSLYLSLLFSYFG